MREVEFGSNLLRTSFTARLLPGFSYLVFLILPAEHDEEDEETEDEDDEAEEDGGDEAEDDVALLRDVRSAGGGVGQGQGLTPVTAGGRAALGRQ